MIINPKNLGFYQLSLKCQCTLFYLGIGEIGLDFHHAKTLEKRNKQVNELKKIFDLTVNYNKPYVLHVRNASEHEFDRGNSKHRYIKRDGATIC
ncbi:MAG: TatD family hydrolase [Candidatus Lokiarchaeota archaeon]|nr:TatD family hydrolase [Candidatus Lokiarchaeota archaeon]